MNSILFVDDDPQILASFQRQFGRSHDIKTANGAQEALSLINNEGPFAVVVSDMRMPKTNGIEFLKSIKETAPETVRIMLTGNADQQTAVSAVNDGNIFRFHTKPCAPEELIETIEEGLEQYRLVTAEKKLLEQTLAGSVKVLVDVLAMINPEAFGRAQYRRDWVLRVARQLDLSSPWTVGIAAMLCDLGSITIPHEIMNKARKGAPLSPREKNILENTPATGQKLITNIPRMQAVGEIIFYHQRGFDGTGFPKDGKMGKDIPVAARIIKVVNDAMRRSPRKKVDVTSVASLDEVKKLYDPEILNAVKKILLKDKKKSKAVITIRTLDIKPGQVIAENLLTDGERLVLAADEEATPAQVASIHNLVKLEKIPATVKVRSTGT